jgi:hypothetical protein
MGGELDAKSMEVFFQEKKSIAKQGEVFPFDFWRKLLYIGSQARYWRVCLVNFLTVKDCKAISTWSGATAFWKPLLAGVSIG